VLSKSRTLEIGCQSLVRILSDIRIDLKKNSFTTGKRTEFPTWGPNNCYRNYHNVITVTAMRYVTDLLLLDGERALQTDLHEQSAPSVFGTTYTCARTV